MGTRAERLSRYVELEYPVEITRDEFGYLARIPDLPGCESNGTTLEDAVAAIAEAKEAWLEAALDGGIPIPEPRGEDDYSGKFVVRVPSSVHRDLVRIASLEGVSLNALVSSVLARETGRFEDPPRRVLLPATRAEVIGTPEASTRPNPTPRPMGTVGQFAHEERQVAFRSSWSRPSVVSLVVP